MYKSKKLNKKRSQKDWIQRRRSRKSVQVNVKENSIMCQATNLLPWRIPDYSKKLKNKRAKR